MKRVLKWLGAVVVLLVVLLAAGWYSAFGKNSSIEDGRVLVAGVETVKDGFVSAYVLDAGGDRTVLVDAGNDASAKAILAALARQGRSASSVQAIFLTHGHGDHIAGCKAFPAADVYALEADVAMIGDGAKVTRGLHDGEVVQVGDLRVEAFAVPGHTPGSAAYLARGVLFLGDSAGASKDGVVMPAVRLFSKDPAANVASLQALSKRLAPRAAEVQVLAFAHTGPLPGLEPLAAFARGR